ncbi:hypothetical protein [Daphnis nerii cypovirus]|uniref:hypothetical protein n=1 Tax=Daphnis nerii cypovirus TaxID=1986950 RepID=UPI000EB61D10|nr:hypothetical protein [Daphnis nerii cypovirus]AYA29390.1 hypothetical protein [Daphnis nerii cypovirus]
MSSTRTPEELEAEINKLIQEHKRLLELQNGGKNAQSTATVANVDATNEGGSSAQATTGTFSATSKDDKTKNEKIHGRSEADQATTNSTSHTLIAQVSDGIERVPVAQKGTILLKQLKTHSASIFNIQKLPPLTLQSLGEAFPENDSFKLSLKSVTLSNSLLKYVKYEFVSATDVRGERYTTRSAIDVNLTTKTAAMYKLGTLHVTQELHEDILNRANVERYKNIPMAQGADVFGYRGMQDSNAVTPKNLRNYALASLRLCYAIMTDRRLVYGQQQTKDDRKTIDSDSPLSLLTASQYPAEEADPNPGLVPLIQTDAEWFERAITEEVMARGEEKVYWYGLLDKIEGRLLQGRKSDVLAGNIDMYTAANSLISMTHLLELQEREFNLKNQLEAFAYARTQFQVPPANEYCVFDCENRQHLERVLMHALILWRSLPNAICEMNQRFLEDSGMIRLSDQFRVIPSAMQTDATTAALVAYITSQMYQGDLNQILRMYALEMGVHNTIYYISRPTLADWSKPESIIVLIEMILYAVFFPSNAARIKGEIAENILNFFKHHINEEYNVFTANYGVHFRSEAGVPIRVNLQRRWRQNQDQLSDLHHSFYWPGVLQGCPLLNRVRNLMQPRGVLRPDEAAMNADFPRVSRNPSHYIPYQQGNGDVHDDIYEFSLTLQTNIGEILNYMRNMQRFTRNTNYDTMLRYVTYITQCVGELGAILCEPAHHVLASMGNHAYNFIQNFDGDFNLWKEQQYGLTNNEGTPVKLIQTEVHRDEQRNLLQTGIIWTMLFNTDGPAKRNKGTGMTLMSTNYSVGARTIPILSAVQFQNYLESKPEHYLVVDENVDDIMINETHENGIRLFVIEDTATDDAKDAIIDLDGERFMTSSLPVANIREHFSGDVNILEDYAGINILSITQVLNIIEDNHYGEELAMFRARLPNLKNETLNKLLDDLVQLVGNVSSTPFGKYLLMYTDGIRIGLTLRNPLIRRLSLNNEVIAFDPQIDNESFEHNNSFITEYDRQRLRVALNLLNNPRFKPLQGIRIVKTNVRNMYPEQTYDEIDGIEVIHYNQNEELFGSINDAGREPQLAYPEEATGQLSPLVTSWPRRRVVFSKYEYPKRFEIAGLLNAVENAGWILDFPDLHYVYSVEYNSVKSEGTALEDILVSSHERIHEFTFVDSTSRISGTIISVPRSYNTFKYIYPLQDPTWLMTTREITNFNNNMPERAILPSREEYSTGRLSADGLLIYNNGIEKLRSNVISMTNCYYKLSELVKTELNVVINQENPYTLDALIVEH